MTLQDALIVFAANFVFIFLKAFQQRNVVGRHYTLIQLVSFAMAATEVWVIWQIAQYGPTVGLVAALGASGGLGASVATWIHHKHIRPKN